MKHQTSSPISAWLRAFVAAAVLFTLPVVAQTSGGGTVQGTVKDSTEALIPGAKVIIRHLATGRVFNSVANSEGFFVSPQLAIGKYRVRVEAQGMKAWEGELTVETARTSEINPVLSLGEVSETVVISGNITPLITTTDPTDGSTLDSQRIQELPLNGRNLNKLLEDVTPGVEGIVDVNGGVRVAGLMVYSTDYIQDGAASNNREFGGSGNLQGLESIAEVKVETSTSSAKYSRPTSVIVTTKGGSNRIHGALFETHRNNAFGVARARQDVLPGGDYEAPKLIRNEFGGTISGPVFLPTFGLNGKGWYNGKNRTFFLVSREGLRFRQGITRDFRVPTAAMRQGDFSDVVDSLNRSLIIYDPLTGRNVTLASGRVQHLREPFPGNRIPISRISPLAKFVFGITPLPNDITNPLVSSNLKMPVPTNTFPNTDDNPMTVRLDHVITQRDNFFLKVNGGKRPAYFLGTAGNNGAPTANNEANVTYLTFESIAGSASWTHVFSPTLSVETLVNRSWINSTTVTGPEFIDYPKQLGLPNPYGEIGWPNLVNLGLTNYTYIEGDNRRGLYSIVTNAEQNYTWVKKTHNIQFGGRFHHERQHLLPDQGAISGTANFNSLATALHSPTLGTATNPQAVPQTGFDVANFFLGHAARYDVGLKRGIMRVSEKNYGLYFQDNWKVNKRLTLTPGLRWDMNPAFTEKSSALNVFDLNSHALVFPEPLEYYYRNGTTTPKIVSLYQNVGVKFLSAEQAGLPKRIFKDNWFDIGPRAGFAYRMFDGNQQMVIRGGYGMYISAVPMRTLLAQFSSLAPFRATFVHNPNAAAQSPDGISNYLLRTVPSVIAGSNSANIIDLNNPSAIGRGVAVRGMDGKQSSLKIHEWNLTIEKQLAKSTVFRLSYKGKHGVNTDQLYEVNPQANDYIWYTTTGLPTPTGEFSGVARRVYDQTAYTEVRILQRSGYINTAVWSFELERRFSKGLGFQAFYTLTNALRLAGNSFRDDVVGRPEVYLPGTVPTDPKEFNRFLFYDRDIGSATNPVPKHRVRWNWNYELPFGKGRSFGRNASGFLNGVIGGWKFSGSGTMLSTWYAMPVGQWGEFGNFEVYGKKHKILDCRATPATATDPSQERCTRGYLWFNGYISQAVINRTNAAGLKTGVHGLPDNYKPAQQPRWPAPPPGAPLPPGYRSVNDYDTNVAYVPLRTGAEVRVNYDTGLHPWRNQYLLGPFNWVTDASMLKFFQVTEKVRVRVNLDVFNVFNTQGFNAPNAEGILSLGSSYVNFAFRPRQLQGTVRVEW